MFKLMNNQKISPPLLVIFSLIISATLFGILYTMITSDLMEIKYIHFHFCAGGTLSR